MARCARRVRQLEDRLQPTPALVGRRCLGGDPRRVTSWLRRRPPGVGAGGGLDGGSRSSARGRCASPACPAGHRGLGSNHKKAGLGGALGRSRGGLTTKIHLAADLRCRPVSRLTTPGQLHDSIGCQPVLAGVRIARPRGGPARIRPDTSWRTRRTPARRSEATWLDGRSEPPFPNLPTSSATASAAASRRRRSTPTATGTVTSSNAASTSSRSTVPWPPATTSASTPTEARSTSPRSGSGSATPFHDPSDTPQPGVRIRGDQCHPGAGGGAYGEVVRGTPGPLGQRPGEHLHRLGVGAGARVDAGGSDSSGGYPTSLWRKAIRPGRGQGCSPPGSAAG